MTRQRNESSNQFREAVDKAVIAHLAERMGAVLARIATVGHANKGYGVVPMDVEGAIEIPGIPCIQGLYPQVNDIVRISVNHYAFDPETWTRDPNGLRYSWQSTIITAIVNHHQRPREYIPADRITQTASKLTFDLDGWFDNYAVMTGDRWTFQSKMATSNAEVEFELNDGKTLDAAPIYTTQEVPAGFSELGVYTIVYADDETWRKHQ